MRFFSSIFVFVILLGVLSLLASRGLAKAPGADIVVPQGAALLSVGPKGSSLYRLHVNGSVYEESPYLLDLTARTSFEQGYDAGFLLGEQFAENYNSLLSALLGDEWWEPAAARVIGAFLDWQWEAYLSQQLPSEYVEEMRGLSAGGRAAAAQREKERATHTHLRSLSHRESEREKDSHRDRDSHRESERDAHSERDSHRDRDTDVGVLAGRGITLANLPGSLSNIKYILIDELGGERETKLKEAFMRVVREAGFTQERLMKLLHTLLGKYTGFQCSMFGVWGSRTQDKRLFTGRNLDYLKDSGIAKYKLVTVYHPRNGIAHATLGWAGIWGAITGFSSAGITVHEANLESDDITFRGFPWIVRLRHVMANAHTLAEAKELWLSTNNTVGYNHGIGSAQDGEAMVMETMKSNTAFFSANDPRERSLIVNGRNIGAPRDEAVYRTNHGYDAYTLQHYMWNGTNAYEYSVTRYMLFPELLDDYQSKNEKISHEEAVRITAIVGDKGSKHIYDCDGPHDQASNILSVTFDPAESIAYTAWENGHKESWIPAACSTYLALDMKPWFNKKTD